MKDIERYNNGLNENINIIQSKFKDESFYSVKSFINNEVDKFNVLLPDELIKKMYEYSLSLVKKINVSFLITGVDRDGKRFRIETEAPQHYNIYKGSLWKITEGKKKLIKRYY